jgi:hypothetical protein
LCFGWQQAPAASPPPRNQPLSDVLLHAEQELALAQFEDTVPELDTHPPTPDKKPLLFATKLKPVQSAKSAMNFMRQFLPLY